MIIPSNIKAIIFDYDGVLGDSTAFNTYACKQSAKMCGIDLEQSVYERCAPGGATIHDIASCIMTHYGKPNMVKEYITYKKTFDLDYVKEVEILPGARDLVSSLSVAYPLAVNTGTRHFLVDSFLQKYRLTKHLKAVVAAEDILCGKPDPESYLLAARLLNINPHDCLVVEDGISGVVSAKKAGCYVVGVVAELSGEKLLELGCDQIVTSLKEIMAPSEA